MTYTWEEKDGVNWVFDENDNRCSDAYFGSKENALEALKSLVDCRNCSDCSDCSLQNNNKLIMSPIPKLENVHQKVLEAASKPEGLNMSSWHTCDTTHCRAGWVVHLAGEQGYALEKETNTPFAAMLIYKESSDIGVSMMRFYEDKETAMADIRRCAELEKQKEKTK